MRRAWLLLLLSGCAGAPPPEPIVPASTGGTMYVVDTWADFFDDGGKLGNPDDGPIRWLGEQALRIVLRAVARGRTARLLGSSWTELENGRQADFKVEWPLDYMEPVGGGRYAIRRSSHSGGITLDAKPILSSDGKYVTVDYRIGRRVASRKPLGGSELEVGEPTNVYGDPVDKGTLTIPAGGTLVWSVRRDGDRIHLVLLHLASVDRR